MSISVSLPADVAAIHEAAHAVLAVVHGIRLVKVAPTSVLFEPPPIRYQALRKIRGVDAYRQAQTWEARAVLNYLEMLAAGECAASFHFGIDGTGAADYEDSANYLAQLGADPIAIRALIVASQKRSVRRVLELSNEIAAVADALSSAGELDAAAVKAAMTRCRSTSPDRAESSVTCRPSRSMTAGSPRSHPSQERM